MYQNETLNRNKNKTLNRDQNAKTVAVSCHDNGIHFKHTMVAQMLLSDRQLLPKKLNSHSNKFLYYPA